MNGRHARPDHPPSIPGTLAERATRRPARVAFVLATGVALVGPMVAAQPVDHPTGGTAPAVRTTADTSTTSTRPEVDTDAAEDLGMAAIVAANVSSGRAEATAGAAAEAAIAAREAAAREAAAREAARQAAEEAARAEQAARRDADAAAAGQAAAPAPAVPSGSVWDSLAQCESGGNWAINTGNGYYGGLQFSLSSWRGVGGTGYPHEHSRETQIAMAERLQASGGWGQWPACSRKLGLR